MSLGSPAWSTASDTSTATRCWTWSVEMPSRGMTALSYPGRFARLAELLDHELADLDEP
ncbi:hypothetical protein [Micromonospora sp. RTP1Z1]|uniref:hypothetical protein n=1 Tax=Micromonospora sp. RTP1Z1 TaxID=2994043 RepID=UPI0029C89D89|nr:hypothetical protein [Micromonospora sp. RTP1Z1]